MQNHSAASSSQWQNTLENGRAHDLSSAGASGARSTGRAPHLRDLLQQDSRVTLDAGAFGGGGGNESRRKPPAFKWPAGGSSSSGRTSSAAPRKYRRENRTQRWTADAAPYFRRYSLLPMPPRRSAQRRKAGGLDTARKPTPRLTEDEVSKLANWDQSLGALARLVINVDKPAVSIDAPAPPIALPTIDHRRASEGDLLLQQPAGAEAFTFDWPYDVGVGGAGMGTATWSSSCSGGGAGDYTPQMAWSSSTSSSCGGAADYDQVSPVSSSGADSGVYTDELEDGEALRDFLDQTQHLPLSDMSSDLLITAAATDFAAIFAGGPDGGVDRDDCEAGVRQPAFTF